jgi:hypothetical protein
VNRTYFQKQNHILGISCAISSPSALPQARPRKLSISSRGVSVNRSIATVISATGATSTLTIAPIVGQQDRAHECIERLRDIRAAPEVEAVLGLGVRAQLGSRYLLHGMIRVKI